MAQPFTFEKPIGMRDVTPQAFQHKNQAANRFLNVVKQWGYDQVQTPALEYFETVGRASAIADKQLFKLIDFNGQTLVLRPDMTAPIARLVSSTMKQVPYPIRLSYYSSLYRAQQVEGGKPAEFDQVGVELIGDASGSSDEEVLVLLQEALIETGLTNFQVAIGHIHFLNSVFKEILSSEEDAEALRRYLYEKNDVGFREFVLSLELTPADRDRLFMLTELRGGVAVLDQAAELVYSQEGKQSVNELRRLWQVLIDEGLDTHSIIDLSVVLHMEYYTGCVFEIYHEKTAQPIGSGGRYDGLLENFGRRGSATGFGVRVDLLAEALNGLVLNKKMCIVFDSVRRKEAYDRAKELRSEGTYVVLQNKNGMNNLEELDGSFTQVETMCE
ncbi:ATP phosphoribosyltransferase regulatory subunit [Alkalihalobacillus xiaoxiensis]|uniref:ATP phosphoribosyltransferase regulatory subunit n=1 Tax=Shouchella xiaoxiensis TaxID=766895 RepID=A0ABS2SY64_9BACI|nr:ATP phosphoribosyltransferase regulatory subunit [Shouchella xiaoxiensis]MBM7840468.1 ATP phosphoribosyltransferase regulatory subunit [Shouchella xiaoxiensis]